MTDREQEPLPPGESLFEAFSRVSVLEEPEREAALRELPEELAREVRRLLEADRSALAESLNRQGPWMAEHLLALHTLFPVGMQLGPYQVEESLSGDRLGVVFRAIDQRNGQSVALKILAPELARSRAWLARFQREIAVLRAVEDRGIVRMLEAGEAAGIHYFSMELIEGPTLRERLREAAPEAGQATSWAAEIAGALRAAHRAGFLHNDLKPENIMVRPDGRLVLLDFGLTRPLNIGLAPAAPEGTNSSQTWSGGVSGTIGYLSPERVAGWPADARSDVFSLAVLLYEMLVGETPFARANPLAVAAAILHEEPKPLPPHTPHAALIAQCLEKDPDRRPQSVDEFLRRLRPTRAVGSRKQLVWAAAALVLAMTLVGVSQWWTARPGEAMLRLDAEISPDGRYLAYVSNVDNRENLDLYVEDRARGTRRRLTDTQGSNEREPSFSADGRKIVFRTEAVRERAIHTMEWDGQMEGKGAVAKKIGPGGFRPRWSPDGRWIVYSSMSVHSPSMQTRAATYVLPAGGEGEPRAITPETGNHRTPVWMGDGTVLVVEYLEGRRTQFRRVDPATGQSREVIPFSISDEPVILFQALGTRDVLCLYKDGNGQAAARLYVVSLDSRKQREAGPDGVVVQTASVAASGEGIIVAVPRRRRFARLPIGAPDKEEFLANLPPDTTGFAVHPGDQFGFLVAEGKLHRYDVPARQPREWGGVRTKSFRPSLSQSPAKLVFDGDGRDLLQSQLTWVLDAGAKPARMERPLPGGGIVWDISPDARYVARATMKPPHGIEVLAMPEQSNLWEQPVAKFQLAERNLFLAGFSPNGRWITFIAEEIGLPGSQYIAAMQPGVFNNPAAWIELPADGAYGRWSVDMRKFYYVSRADGHFCLYSLDMDPVTGQPQGKPQAVRHYHDFRYSLVNLMMGQFRLSVSSQAIYFPVTEMASELTPFSIP